MDCINAIEAYLEPAAAAFNGSIKDLLTAAKKAPMYFNDEHCNCSACNGKLSIVCFQKGPAVFCSSCNKDETSRLYRVSDNDTLYDKLLGANR